MSKKDAQTDARDRKTRPAADRITTEYHLNALIARQYLSIDEIVTANQVALDNLQNVWSRQCDMAAEAFRSLSTVIDKSAKAGHAVDPQISEYARRSRQVFEKSLAHTRELTDMTTAATKALVVQAGRQARKHMEALHQASGPNSSQVPDAN
jgi:hypothetical protein